MKDSREGTEVGNLGICRPAIRWLHSVEGDIKTMGVGNWRRGQWRAIAKEAKDHRGL
jgi:hypothetical protein